jgi:hypothetical protein
MKQIHCISEGLKTVPGVGYRLQSSYTGPGDHRVFCLMCVNSAFVWLKEAEEKVDHSPSYSALFKNEWSYTSNPPYAFITCRGSFIFATDTNFLIYTASIPVLGPAHSSLILRICGHFPGVKEAGPEADHSHPVQRIRMNGSVHPVRNTCSWNCV